MSSLRRWLIMTVLCFSGGIIYMLPFLHDVFYIPMQEAFGYSHTQMGLLSSGFGTVALLSYFPGGWLADRYSPRTLISIGLLGTGLAGFSFATFPSYEMSLALFGLWGAFTSLLFWGAMIKATRGWGAADEQGKAFGILESGRGVAEAGSALLVGTVFAWAGSNATALSQVINLYAATNIALAFMTWFILDDGKAASNDNSTSQKVGLKEILEVLKLPEVWLIAIIVMASYSAYWGAYYFARYAPDVFEISVSMGIALGISIKFLKPISPLVAGFMADRIGVSRGVFYCLLVMTVCFFIFGILPAGSAYLIIMLVNVFFVSMAIFAVRGIYFALMDEGGIAPAVTGTAAGVISAVGFTPDVFMPLLGGMLLDAYPGVVGYQYYYMSIMAICSVGTVAAFIMLRRSEGRKAVAGSSAI